jgi:hypothetical protein
VSDGGAGQRETASGCLDARIAGGRRPRSDNIIALFPAGDEATLNDTLYRGAAAGCCNRVDILICINDDRSRTTAWCA